MEKEKKKKESACNGRDLGLLSGLERLPGEGIGYPLLYSGLENFMDRGSWQATVHEVAESVRKSTRPYSKFIKSRDNSKKSNEWNLILSA